MIETSRLLYCSFPFFAIRAACGQDIRPPLHACSPSAAQFSRLPEANPTLRGAVPSVVRLSPVTGIPQVTFPDWLSTTFNPADGQPGMATDIDAGVFASDDLLARVQADLDAFYWQSHTFSHLARDNLGLNDCRAEDAGEV